MPNTTAERIVILDFGSQYTQLVARRVRELGAYSSILPYTCLIDEILAENTLGVILSGGPNSVGAETTALALPQGLLQAGIPILGICYGMQAIAQELGGTVEASATAEFGHGTINLNCQSRLFSALTQGNEAPQFDVWLSHGDHVTTVPQGFRAVASSKDCPIAVMEDIDKNIYGVQFHPEVEHTPQGGKILQQFLGTICGCSLEWSPEKNLQDRVEQLRKQVGNEEVVLGLSGGVDSSVTAILLRRAIGIKLHCVFIDNGLLRKGEVEQVLEMMKRMDVNVHLVKARTLFLRKLRGVTDPERKRMVIGATFIEVFEHEALGLSKNITYLAQGTIYPDVIESARAHDTAHVIKSHHNVGGLPQRMKLKLVEPLRDLFKDEVRKLGLALDIPKDIINRHPFPGPGLGVRMLGEINEDYLDILKEADDILIRSLKDSDWYDKCAQALAVFIPQKTTGVVGDQRRYGFVIALRVVVTSDYMTAKAAQLPFDLLSQISREIVNTIPEISRVVYDITDKPPATIEWE